MKPGDKVKVISNRTPVGYWYGTILSRDSQYTDHFWVTCTNLDHGAHIVYEGDLEVVNAQES